MWLELVFLEGVKISLVLTSFETLGESIATLTA
jgi:hypothetical protein